MKCSNCNNEMVQSKAGWLCVECGHVELTAKPAVEPATTPSATIVKNSDTHPSDTIAGPPAEPKAEESAEESKPKTPEVAADAKVEDSDKPVEVESAATAQESVDAAISELAALSPVTPAPKAEDAETSSGATPETDAPEDKPIVAVDVTAESPEKELEESIAAIVNHSGATPEATEVAAPETKVEAPEAEAPPAESESESETTGTAAETVHAKAANAYHKPLIVTPASTEPTEQPQKLEITEESKAEPITEATSEAKPTVEPEPVKIDVTAAPETPAPPSEAPVPEPLVDVPKPEAPVAETPASEASKPESAAPEASPSEPETPVPMAQPGPAPAAPMPATASTPSPAPTSAATPVAVASNAPAAAKPLTPHTHPKPLSTTNMAILGIAILVILVGVVYIGFLSPAKPFAKMLGMAEDPSSESVAVSSTPIETTAPTPANATPEPQSEVLGASAAADPATNNAQRATDLAAYMAAYKADATKGFFALNPPTVPVTANDPSTAQPYTVSRAGVTTGGQIQYVPGGNCHGASITPGAGGSRYLALVTLAEGSNPPICVDNR